MNDRIVSRHFRRKDALEAASQQRILAGSGRKGRSSGWSRMTYVTKRLRFRLRSWVVIEHERNIRKVQ